MFFYSFLFFDLREMRLKSLLKIAILFLKIKWNDKAVNLRRDCIQIYIGSTVFVFKNGFLFKRYIFWTLVNVFMKFADNTCVDIIQQYTCFNFWQSKQRWFSMFLGLFRMYKEGLIKNVVIRSFFDICRYNSCYKRFVIQKRVHTLWFSHRSCSTYALIL